jgi:hypothetical protein
MTSLCPRCSTPQAGGSPFCPSCGFDFRAQPTPPPPPAQFAPPPPPPPSAPATCPRCYSPLYPGYTRCGNCGFDSAQQPPAYGAQPTYQQPAWGTPPPAPGPWVAQPAAEPARKSNLPIFLAIGGVLLLAAAGGLFVMMPKSSASGSPSPSPIAVASASATASATTLPSEAPVTAEPTSSDTPTSAATVEPSPDFAWSAFTAPDKKWSVRFPGTAAPITESLPLPIGTTSVTLTMYATQDASSSALYAVAFLDVPAGTFPGNPNTYLALMDSSLATGMGGTLVSSSDSTVGTYPARDLNVLKGTQTYYIRIWFVGNRLYMLMTISEADATVYTQHFMATFALK